MTSPCLHVHHHQAALSSSSRWSAKLLQLPVDGEPDILARHARLVAQLADDAAIGVDFDAAGAGLAAHFAVEGLLDAALADAKARQVQQRIVVVASDLSSGRDRRRHSPGYATSSSPKG